MNVWIYDLQALPCVVVQQVVQRDDSGLRNTIGYYKIALSFNCLPITLIFCGGLEVGFSDYGNVIMSTIASQITSLTIVYSTVYSSADQRKYQSSASLAFVRGIHRSPVNSPHKGPVMRKMCPFDDVIMCEIPYWGYSHPIITISRHTLGADEICSHPCRVGLGIYWSGAVEGHCALCCCPIWRHQVETFSALLNLCERNSPTTGEFPSQRPETLSLYVFFDLRLNKRLSKPSGRLWFEEPSRLLWRHCNVLSTIASIKPAGSVPWLSFMASDSPVSVPPADYWLNKYFV